ncbi:MAG: hypothetical protein LBH59_02050 [Planctomycetaceae bacterium]|jgi:hypothetical protein|nr:hypothetical protein [Planctomycetaceae bacterium]
MKQFILLTVAVLCLTAIGCSNTVQVNGKVTLEDGTPVTRGTINFNNGEYEARGNIKQDGTYQIATDASGHGLKSGDYKVFFAATENMDYDLNKRLPVIDEKYNSAETTDLTITIKENTNFSPKLKPYMLKPF